jgi:hypothetical protein
MQTSDGKIVAQERYASRLPRVMARQDYLCDFTPIFRGWNEKM